MMMMMEGLILIVCSLCLLQVRKAGGQVTELPQTQNQGAILFRLSSLESWTVSVQKEFTDLKARLAEINSRLDELSSSLAVQRPAFDGELTKNYISELFSSTLETIQEGLANEKQHRVDLEYMALETKVLINTQTGLLKNRIEDNKELINNQTELFQKKTGLLENRTGDNKELIHNQTELFQKKTGLLENRIETCLTAYKGKDCWDLKAIHGISKDGVYDLLTPDGHIISLRCDMTTDGGGWTVFQRRGDGSVRFNNTYAEYESFFGNLTEEFWMGNDFLNVFTRDVKQTLRVDICDWDNEARWAQYKHFSVGPSADKYRLGVEDYSGTAGDALIIGYRLSRRSHNGAAFSTPDVDNDNWAKDCASVYHSGWWYNRCQSANLNGVYKPDGSSRTNGGIQWYTWIVSHSLKGSEMKMRPSTATSSTNKPFKCPVI